MRIKSLPAMGLFLGAFLLLASPRYAVAYFIQEPILNEDHLNPSAWRFPSDATCNRAVDCPASEQIANAVAVLWDIDLGGGWFVDDVVVWGLYLPGTDPPPADSFTVVMHDSPSSQHAPSATVICSESGIEGTRTLVGNVFGFDVYEHVLPLSEPCDFSLGHGTLGCTRAWFQVFNDSGIHDDWFWLPGYYGSGNPCTGDFESAVDPDHAPGQWSHWQTSTIGTPLAFTFYEARAGDVDLRIGKREDGDLELSWSEDCGSGFAYNVYRGNLDAGYSSLAPEPGFCEITPTTAVLDAGFDWAEFFLVVPIYKYYDFPWYPDPIRTLESGWGYGSDSDGTRRPRPSTACHPGGGSDACVLE